MFLKKKNKVTNKSEEIKVTDQKVTENFKYSAKSDKGKLQISLVPMQILRDVAEVRMYGNNKYHSPSNWAVVEKQRYVDALMRHLLAYLDDPKSVDEESGIPHYKHLACNMAFLCEMERADWENRKQEIISKDENLMKRIEDENKILKKQGDSPK